MDLAYQFGPVVFRKGSWYFRIRHPLARFNYLAGPFDTEQDAEQVMTSPDVDSLRLADMIWRESEDEAKGLWLV